MPQFTLIRTLELVGILMSDAPLNRAQGRFPNAEKIDQRGEKEEAPDIQESLRGILKELRTLKKK